MEEWEVPGLELLALLGYGSTGEVWRARSPHGIVALRRLTGTRTDALTEVRRLATVVRSLPTRHVVRVRSTTRAQGDEVLVLDHADGGSLAALLTQRGTVTPGEVVTVLAPVAEALALAHAHGLVHRRLSARQVLLTGDGMPLLDGLGLDPLHDPQDSLDPSGALGTTADVWAVGALGHRMLTGREPDDPEPAWPVTAPRPLVDALTSALDPDPLVRPTASDLAAQLLAACPAQPLSGLPDPVEPAAAPPPQRRTIPKPVLAVLGAAVALGAVVGIGWTWGARSAPATASVTAVPTDWRGVLTALDAQRGRAFATGRPELLAQVYAPGTAALADDTAALADLRHRQVTARGLVHRFGQLTPGRVRDGEAVLRVEQSLPAYALVDLEGRVVERHTAGPLQRVVVTLVHEPGGWRVNQVEPGG